jgi:hypothetical protein
MTYLQPPTLDEYQRLAAATQERLAGLDFDNDDDYREGMAALGELNRQGALLKLKEANDNKGD